MLNINNLIGFGADATVLAEISYRQNYELTTNSTTYTFTNCDIGAASQSRVVAVGIVASGNTTNPVSSVTIGGISASNVVNNGTTSTNNKPNCAIYSAKVPTGTTANIVVTWGGGKNRCQIGVYRLIVNAESAKNTAIDNDDSDPASVNITVFSGDVVLALATVGNSTTTTTWTGVVEDFDVASGEETQILTMGSASSSVGGSLSISADFAVTKTYSSLLAATWR